MLGIQHHAPPSRTKKKNGEIKLQKVCTTDDLFRCCLYLGTATQVHLRCASFGARGLPELKRKIASMSWNKILKPDSIKNGNLDVRVVSSKSKLYHTGAIRDRVLQGIDQHFGNDEDHYNKEERQKRGSDTFPTVLLNVNVLRDEVQISINAYPTPLHQRGYRKQVAKAPLREDLAFAMLFTAGWTPAWSLDDEKMTGNEWQGLMDPFCGSGTIAIEGAAMMLGLPPGRLRDRSPFQGTLLEDTQNWSAIVRNSIAKAEMKQLDKTSLSISASDRDLGAVEATKANAQRAGVLNALTIERASLSGQRWFEKPSESPSSLLVVTNPPFGKRISSKSSPKGILTLYQSLGHFIQRLAHKHARKACGVVLTNNPALVMRSGISIPFKTSFKTFHGGLKVSAMKFDASSL
jgi:putative N6-adenine-specific DNA methylase